MRRRAVRASLDPGGHQVVEVTIDAGYHPARIIARAGRPLRLVFRRDEDDPCSERVVFSAPRLDRRLAPRATTIVELPARPPGRVRFTCGMGRYRGLIELVGDRGPSIAQRLADRLSDPGAPLVVALVPWFGSLPLLALGAVLVVEGGLSVVIAAVVLAAWLGGCLWAAGRSARSA